MLSKYYVFVWESSSDLGSSRGASLKLYKSATKAYICSFGRSDTLSLLSSEVASEEKIRDFHLWLSMLFNWTLMDRSRKAVASVPTAAASIVGTGVGTGGGVICGVLLGTGGRGGWRAATREYLLVSPSIMMDITCDSPDCVLIAFLNLFQQIHFSELSRSLLWLFLLIFRCFLMEDLP